MSSPTDPIRTWRRRRAIAGSAGAATVLAACTWAIRPLTGLADAPAPIATLSPQAPPGPSVDKTPLAFDASLFQIRLWHAPLAEEPPSEANAQSSPPAPNLELIAIIDERDRYLAAIYDLGADRLHIVADGQQIGRLHVVAISGDGVDLREGSRLFRLALSPSPARHGEVISLRSSEEVRP